MTPISDEYATRLINAAKDGDIYSYGVSGGEDLFTVMSGLNNVPADQYVPQDVLFELMHTLTEPVEYINQREPAGYVFGSGPIGFDDENSYTTYLRQFTSENSDYAAISNTQSAQLLMDYEFNDILRNTLLKAMAADGYKVSENPAQAYYDGLMGYRDENDEMHLGLWDAVSLAFSEHAHGHIITLTPWAKNDRIFVRTELPALLKNEAVETINGHPREEFVEAFEEYRADGLSEEDALAKLNRTKIMGSSYEFMSNYSEGFAAALPPHLQHDFQKMTVDGYVDWTAKAEPVLNGRGNSTAHYDLSGIPGAQQLEIEEAAL